MLMFPLEMLAWIMALAGEAETAAERVYEVFDTEPAIADRPGAIELSPDVRGRGALRGRVVRLRGQRPHRAAGLDLGSSPGETIALVGATGSGKTTLVTLLTRLYDPTEGRVTLDGHDLRDLTVTSLRRHVGFAFEEPSLFSASVRENLLMGKPDATEDEIQRGARRRPGRLRPRPAVGPRHPHRRAGPVALGRPAPAARARPGDHRPAPGARARRPALGARRAHRGARRRTRCARCSRTAPCSSSCTARRRSRSPTAPSSSTAAGSSPSAPTTTCSTSEPRYRAVLCEDAEDLAEEVQRMTSVEPDEVHDIDPDAPLDLTGDELVDAWRGVNAEDVEETTGGLAGLLRTPQPRAARLAAATAPPRLVHLRVLIAVSTACQLAGPVAHPARHRRRHPAAARRRQRHASAADGRRRARARSPP